PPPSSPTYTCEEQVLWGKCNESWMEGFCCKSCANAKTLSTTCGTSDCSDKPPPGPYTCAEQVSWGKCNESWMEGFCCKSCANKNRC
ncbi:hypothetical protein PFISCL1PPCAC_24111, partial [Pristionchus fissidentatus]